MQEEETSKGEVETQITNELRNRAKIRRMEREDDIAVRRPVLQLSIVSRLQCGEAAVIGTWELRRIRTESKTIKRFKILSEF
jgi:hypothetical protein